MLWIVINRIVAQNFGLNYKFSFLVSNEKGFCFGFIFYSEIPPLTFLECLWSSFGSITDALSCIGDSSL